MARSLVPQFIDILRSYGVALSLVDRIWMPRPSEWFEKFDSVTADFTYVRWLGDRKGIEEQTKIWNQVIVDRSRESSEWADVLEKLKIPIYVCANNHYSGYGPETVEMFRNLWRQKTGSEPVQLPRVKQATAQSELFE